MNFNGRATAAFLDDFYEDGSRVEACLIGDCRETGVLLTGIACSRSFWWYDDFC